MFGCVDTEQGQAAGEHRPGGFGKREPGAVGGRGFLLPLRQHGVLKPEKRVGHDHEVPGEPVGSVVGGGEGEGPGVGGQGGVEGGVQGGRFSGGGGLEAGGRRFPYVAGFGGETEGGGVSREGAGAGVRVPDTEEGVALPLGEMFVADAGPVVRGGQEQSPAGGVAAEDGGVGGGGHGPQIHDAYGVRRGTFMGDVGVGFMGDVGVGALRGEDAADRVGDDLGPDLVRNAEFDALTCENVAVPITSALRSAGLRIAGLRTAALQTAAPRTAALREDLAGEGAGVVVGEGEIEESGAGDLDAGDSRAVGEAPREELGHLAWRAPGGTGQLQRDVRGVVPAPARPGPLDHGACRNRHAQLTLVDRTAHGAQDGTGELDGGHGTSVWEEGGG